MPERGVVIDHVLRPARPRSEYSPGWYGAFVLDPDGHNVEAVFHDPDA